ncbi:unnamed protein product [Plutella xylostella]|uniref:Conserved oligomeric Golgi complex subunit 8 n=1 Tax=Plutella xylostella TaxID=51655 RepID=A0A8S4FEZ3_PLUXY|nr:unnamed protein product [Plutella xylostella]
MSQELKELCQILFPDSPSANHEYFSDIADYIQTLGSQNWEYIRKEPDRLEEEMKQLTEQTQDLAFTNYKTFVESADVSKAIMKDLGKSKESLEVFLDNMPGFIQECESFSQMVNNIVKEKRTSRIPTWILYDHLHTLNQIIEKHNEFNKPLYLGFVDYSKAFDSITHNSTFTAATTYIQILKKIYNNSTADIKLQNPGPIFNIEKGVKQGDPLSPKLFTATLEEIFRKLAASWERKGIDVQEIGYVDEYIYLGQIASFENRQDKEVERRITNAWKSFWSMKDLMKGTLPLTLKRQLIDMCILPVVTYGAQTWSLTEHQKSKLKTAKLKWAWAGHVCRMHPDRWARIVTEWVPSDGRRRRGRPRRRWRDDLDSRYSGVRNQSEKLLELLELPALMREALNAEDYESALDIFTFIRNLSKRYTDVPIIQNTTSEIMTLWFETLYHLFNQLRYDLPLPQCLQILGYLRRANTVYKSTDGEQPVPSATASGDGLHLHFLKARNAWFENALEEAKNNESPDKLLRRLVELHRVHLFNVLTQHRSIFLTDAQEKDDELNGNSALSCWLKQKVEALALTLNQGLPKEDESSYESLFNQCMYLSLSFGRVGADMRGVLTPLFRDNLVATFHSGLEKADYQFENQMRSYKVPSIKNVARPISEAMSAGPPESLLDYYPLAEYCNGMLNVLNSLRVTAPLNIVKVVYGAFRKSLDKTVQVLLAFYHREQQAFSDVERQNFVSFCICFTEDFVPYIVKCLSLTFPSTQVAECLGVTLTVLQDSKILHIDQMMICEPLNSITGLNMS